MEALLGSYMIVILQNIDLDNKGKPFSRFRSSVLHADVVFSEVLPSRYKLLKDKKNGRVGDFFSPKDMREFIHSIS